MAKSIQEMLNEHKDNLAQMTNVDAVYCDPKLYLGSIDADKEWNDNVEAAQRKFLHTKSYHDFLSDDALILLGRTGTGKTAILRCICENVNNRSIDKYHAAIIVPFDEILSNISDACDDFNALSTREELTRIISMYFNCYVMKALIKAGYADTTSKMYSYIADNGLLNIGEEYAPGKSFEKFKKIILTAKEVNGKVGNTAKTISTILDIADALSQNDYAGAYSEMRELLSTHKVLLLIDTLNEYDLRDAKLVTCVKSLIATCFQYYNTSSQNNIYVKISISSEIHTHIIEQLPGKQQANTVVIRWTNNDLLKLIAIRLLDLYKSGKAPFLKFEGEYQFEDFYDGGVSATANAKRMLYEFLPETCPTSLDYYFDTLSYCIRHTLKKPREAMAIFNAIISKISETNDFKYFIHNDKEISTVIHSTQEGMITSALSMYAVTYPEILAACEVVLNSQKFYFQGKEIEDRLKESEAHCTSYDKEDIKRILIESGLVGKINEISDMPTIDPNDSEEVRLRIIKARFEYQVKGHLTLNRDDYYVIHPMCYEHFACYVDTKTIVFPDTSSNDSDWIQSVRLKKWNI